MDILIKPEVLSLAGAMNRFVISAQKEVVFELKNHETGENIVQHSYAPNKLGRIEVDIENIVAPLLSFELREETEPYKQPAIARKFKVVIKETETEEKQEWSFVVLRAGIDRFADAATNFLKANFLTWQPTVKPVTYYTPEFLTYYAQEDVVCKCKAYVEKNGKYEENIFPLGLLAAGAAWTIPVQYAIIAGKINALPSYYDVWIENTAGDRLSYIQRYYAADIRSEQEQWVLFENSLGGIDTFRAYGNQENTAKHTHNIAEIENVAEEYRVDTERLYKKNTGFLNENERKWLLDFFPSLKKYIYADESIRRIVVTDSDVAYQARELPSNFSFTYKYADAKPFLNLPRTQIPAKMLDIKIPEVESFTIAPRLVELERLPLSGGALFPVQSPYSEKWATTTAAAVLEWISKEITAAYKGDGTFGHAHSNISLLETLSRFGDYLLLGAKKIAAGSADVARKALGLDETSQEWKKILRKDVPDEAKHLIRFLEGIAIGREEDRFFLDANGFAKLYRLILSSVTSSRYVSGDEGIGYSMWEDADGTGNLTIDNLKVRKKMTALELEVRKKTYTSGNLSIGKAGNTIFAVRPYGADGSAISDKVFSVGGMVIAVRKNSVQVLGRKAEGGSPAFYRCYFLRTDGERSVDNCWEVGDDAKCQTGNLVSGTTHNAANRYYWRLVVGKGTETLEDGREYHYVDLSNEETPTIEILPVIRGEAKALVAPDYVAEWDEVTSEMHLTPKAGDVYLYAHKDGPGSEPEIITYTSDTEYTITVPRQDDVYRTADGKLYYADLDYNGKLWIETHPEQRVLKGYDTSTDNDAPMTGDDIAQEGSQTNPARQGLIVIDAEEGISKYKNIDSFSYEGKRKQHIGDTVELEVNRLTIVSEAPDGMEEKHRVPCYMGAWTERAYPYYAQVDCDGSLWLCFNPTGAKKTDRPKDDSRAWRKQVSKGESIDVKGSVPNASSLPTGAQEGDCYITDDDGHMRRWNGTEWKDLGQIKGMDGKNGRDAEVYRLVPLTERAVVGADKRLVASLAYRIEHVVGNAITEVPATQDLRVRYQGDRNVPAPTYMPSGDKPSVSYTLEEYPAIAHPDALHVELVNAKDEVLDRRVIPVTFSTLAALDINGLLGTISAKVQGMTVGGRNLLRGTAFRKEVPEWFKLRSEAVIDKDRKHNDHNSVDCTASGQTANVYKGVFFKTNVEPGKEYTASVWAYGEPATIDLDAYLEIIHTDAQGQRQHVALQSIKPTQTGTWQRTSCTFTVPAGTESIECNIFVVRNGNLHIAETMLTSGSMLTDWQPAPEDAEAYTAEVDVSVGRVDASVTDMKTGLESVGIHLDGEEKKITLNGDTEIVDAHGKATAMFKDGKVRADVIDADKVVANGIQGNTIDAKNATFKNVNVVGEIESKSGSIAGWDFQDGLLGRGKDYDGLSLFDNQIIFNGEDAKRQAALGTFYRHGVPFLALLRDELETLVSKVGMVVSLKNGKGNNFAIAATGGIISCDKGVHDYSLAKLNSSNNVLDLQNGSRFLVSGTNAVYLPRLSALRTSLDILAGVPFSAEATIMAAPGSGRLSVLGRPAGTSGADYIEILDNNANVTGDGAYGGSIPMADGDILCLVMVYDGSRYYALPKTSMT